VTAEATRAAEAAGPALVEFAAGARFVPLRLGAGELLRFSNMELDYRVVERDGRFVLEKRERGGQAWPEVESRELEPVRRALILILGSELRARTGLPRLVTPTEAADLPEGFRLNSSPEGAELTWDDADGSHEARFPGAFGAGTAVRFAQVARLPEDELLASLASA
jgi:hypothetical protein